MTGIGDALSRRAATHRVTDDVLLRVRGEYREMPGLSLTFEQARRLWQLDSATCERVLTVLLEIRFLVRNGHGQYVRCD